MAFPACPAGVEDVPQHRAHHRTWQSHGGLLSWALDELFGPRLQIKAVAAQLFSGAPPNETGSGAAAERAIKKARRKAMARGSDEAGGAAVITPSLINEANKHRRRRRMAAKQRGAGPAEDQAGRYVM